MVALFDFDSVIYQCVHKIISYQEIKFMYMTGSDRYQIEQHIITETIHRINNRTLQVLTEIEDKGIYIESVEYYATACKNSFRKALCEFYKSNRKPNKWVGKVRNHMINEGIIYHSDTLEADDLIANRASQLKSEGKEYIIISIDKDLQQISGLHFNYYPVRDSEGNFLHFKGFNYISEWESKVMLAAQMLSGDSGDRIKGIPKIGAVKSKKIVENCTTEKQLFIAVYRQYYRHGLKDPNFEYIAELFKNYKLLKLGNEY